MGLFGYFFSLLSFLSSFSLSLGDGPILSGIQSQRTVKPKNNQPTLKLYFKVNEGLFLDLKKNHNFKFNCTARQCSPLRRKFIECSINNPALSLLMKHLVIGQR